MFVSYAQNGEDVWLNRIFKGKNDGFYIDVGAHDPEYLSVTKAFYDRGWSGINIEPIPDLYQAFVNARERDLNIQCACGNKDEMLELYLPTAGLQGVATLDAETALIVQEEGIDNTEKITVRVETLSHICSKHASREIDFLSIDVEGFEKNVLLGMNFSQFRPIVIIIEAVKPWKVIQDPIADAEFGTWQEWESILLDAGYLLGTFDGLNRYYVRKENQELLSKFVIPISPLVDNYCLVPVIPAPPKTADIMIADEADRNKEAYQVKLFGKIPLLYISRTDTKFRITLFGCELFRKVKTHTKEKVYLFKYLPLVFFVRKV